MSAVAGGELDPRTKREPERGGRGRGSAVPDPAQGSRPQHLQDELVRLAEAAGRLAEGLVALLFVGVGREEQQLRQVRGLQAPGLHAHEHLPQLRGAQLQMRQQDGCGGGGGVARVSRGGARAERGRGFEVQPGYRRVETRPGVARNRGGAGASPEVERVLPAAN